MSSQKKTPDLATLQAELAEAVAAHEDAKTAESRAARNSTATLNRLNAAQRAIDTALETLRKEAAFDSDWRARTRRREEVTAS